MTPRPSTHNDGFALPATLLAVVVIGALVTGGLLSAMQADRASANVRIGNLAFLAAERGLEDMMGLKGRVYLEDSVGVAGAAVDTVGPVAVTVEGVSAQYTLYVRRLNQLLYMVESEGEILAAGRYAGSQRRLSEFVRAGYTYFEKDRAVTTHVPLRLRGQSGVRGMDSIPSDWTGCVNTGERTGVVAKDSTALDIKGGGLGGLYGNPPSKEDASLDSLDFIQYGDMLLEDLARYPDISLPPGTYTGMASNDAGGVCDKSDNLNWGAPADTASACHYYWPIIHTTGDLHLSSGYGQGILIVEGDMVVTGNFEFTGLVFVYGSMRTSGTGNKMVGSVSILGASVNETEIGTTGAGSTNIQLSTCAIERAHRYSERFARPIPLAERKFVDNSGLGLD
ncbi:MAG: hypothetical protein P8177_05465 [Gemmatimonadota bacterium]